MAAKKLGTRKLSGKSVKRVRGAAPGIAELVEAQARGESVAGVPTEQGMPQDAELDSRWSKKGITSGGVLSKGEAL